MGEVAQVSQLSRNRPAQIVAREAEAGDVTSGIRGDPVPVSSGRFPVRPLRPPDSSRPSHRTALPAPPGRCCSVRRPPHPPPPETTTGQGAPAIRRTAPRRTWSPGVSSVPTIRRSIPNLWTNISDFIFMMFFPGQNFSPCDAPHRGLRRYPFPLPPVSYQMIER